MNPTLPSDIVCLMGTVERPNRPDHPGKHSVWAYSREQVRDNLVRAMCGARADWIIFLDMPNEHDLNNIYLPFLCALSQGDIDRRQRGELRQTYPVMYDKDMRRIFPKELPL